METKKEFVGKLLPFLSASRTKSRGDSIWKKKKRVISFEEFKEI